MTWVEQREVGVACHVTGFVTNIIRIRDGFVNFILVLFDFVKVSDW